MLKHEKPEPEELVHYHLRLAEELRIKSQQVPGDYKTTLHRLADEHVALAQVEALLLVASRSEANARQQLLANRCEFLRSLGGVFEGDEGRRQVMLLRDELFPKPKPTTPRWEDPSMGEDD